MTSAHNRGIGPSDAELIGAVAVARRGELERHAAGLFLTASLVMVIISGSIIVSGWFAGVLVDDWERVFWAGAILGVVMVATFAVAAMPGGRYPQRSIVRITWLLRIGLVLFVVAPVLCLLALAGNFYRF